MGKKIRRLSYSSRADDSPPILRGGGGGGLEEKKNGRPSSRLASTIVLLLLLGVKLFPWKKKKKNESVLSRSSGSGSPNELSRCQGIHCVPSSNFQCLFFESRDGRGRRKKNAAEQFVNVFFWVTYDFAVSSSNADRKCRRGRSSTIPRILV